MADGRDIDGMQPRSWKPADVSKVLAPKVSAKASSSELLAALQLSIAEAVRAIRSDANDDKVRHIVDLVMLRVRGALNEFFEDATAQVQEAVCQQVQAAIEQASQAPSASIQDIPAAAESAVAELAPPKTEQPVAELEQEPSADEQPSDEDKLEATAEVASQSAKLDTKQKSSTASVQSIVEQLSQSMKQLEDTLSESIDAMASVERKTSDIVDKSTLTSKQYKGFIGVVKNACRYAQESVEGLALNISLEFEDIGKRLKSIEATLQKLSKKTNILDIILLLVAVGGLALVIFWDKIKAAIDKWKQTSKVWESLQGFIGKAQQFTTDPVKAVDGMVGEAVKLLGNLVYEWLVQAFKDPLGALTKKLEELWANMCSFGSDVWSWVTGKQKQAAQQQADSETAASEKVTADIEKQSSLLQAAIKDSAAETTAKLDEAAARQQQLVDERTANIEKTASSMDASVSQSAKDAAASAAAASSDLEKNIFPNVEANVTAATDKQLKVMDSKMQSAMDKAQASLDAASANLEKKAQTNAPMANVDTSELDKAQSDAASMGANVDIAPGEKAQIPANVVKSTVTEQGKTTQLYSDKQQVEDANKNAAEIASMPAVSAPSVDSSTPGNGAETQKQIEGKIVVVGPDGKSLDVQALQQKRAAFDSLVQTLTKNEAAFASSSKLLGDLKKTVDEYFSALNGSIDDVVTLAKAAGSGGNESSKPATINNVIVAPGSDNTSDADLEDV